MITLKTGKLRLNFGFTLVELLVAIGIIATILAVIVPNFMGARERAREVARILTEGRWTHDYPITVEVARQLGLNVSTDVPEEVYELMELYPQAIQQRPGIEYIPRPQIPYYQRRIAR